MDPREESRAGRHGGNRSRGTSSDAWYRWVAESCHIREHAREDERFWYWPETRWLRALHTTELVPENEWVLGVALGKFGAIATVKIEPPRGFWDDGGKATYVDVNVSLEMAIDESLRTAET